MQLKIISRIHILGKILHSLSKQAGLGVGGMGWGEGGADVHICTGMYIIVCSGA